LIIIAGTIDVDPEQIEACLAASVPLQNATRNEEPGCLAYCFASDPVVVGRIQVYELWTDQEALAAHFQHPNYVNMRTTLGRFGLRGADTKKYRVTHSEPVYDSTSTPRADFFTPESTLESTP
jgi:quinol monooxygenase YgiN